METLLEEVMEAPALVLKLELLLEVELVLFSFTKSAKFFKFEYYTKLFKGKLIH